MVLLDLSRRVLRVFCISSSPLEESPSTFSKGSRHLLQSLCSSEQGSQSFLYALRMILRSHLTHLERSEGVLYLPYLIFHWICWRQESQRLGVEAERILVEGRVLDLLLVVFLVLDFVGSLVLVLLGLFHK